MHHLSHGRTSRSHKTVVARHGARERIVVVGPDQHFLSGVSYYTARLAQALSDHGPGGDIVYLHQLCPSFIYPGRERIGMVNPSVLDHGPGRVIARVDWHWLRGLFPAAWELLRRPPRALLLQHWTGTALHTHLALALAARVRRVPVLVEFHETIDVSEAERPGVRPYVQAMMRLLLGCTSGIITHATAARDDVHQTFPVSRSLPGSVIVHGPYDTLPVANPRIVEPSSPLQLLFFGVLRSYKGLEDLAEAARLLAERGELFHLTVAGEVWDEAADAVKALESLESFISFERGYLPDDRLADLLGACDVVVLPYRRSVASGPLHIATAAGRTIVCSRLDTLVEATAGYPGIVYARPGDPEDLARAITDARSLVGVRHPNPHSWEHNVTAYLDLLETVEASPSRSGQIRRVYQRACRTVRQVIRTFRRVGPDLTM